MANTRDLKRRTRSVKGTQQITKAMKMVAAAKLRRAQERITAARPYADTIRRVLGNLASRTEHSHPLLEEREVRNVWLVVVSGDKGLCGAFNSNLLRESDTILAEKGWPGVEIVAVGKKAADHYAKRDWHVVHAERETMSQLTADDGLRLGEMFVTAFSSGQVDEVYLLYNRFLSIIRHEIVLDRLLPIEAPEGEETAGDSGIDYLYEPSATELLAKLLPQYVATQAQRALYDSAAAEQAARMTAMDAATKNADEMIEHLTLLYNRARQAAITKEILEIVAGAEALGSEA